MNLYSPYGETDFYADGSNAPIPTYETHYPPMSAQPESDHAWWLPGFQSQPLLDYGPEISATWGDVYTTLVPLAVYGSVAALPEGYGIDDVQTAIDKSPVEIFEAVGNAADSLPWDWIKVAVIVGLAIAALGVARPYTKMLGI